MCVWQRTLDAFNTQVYLDISSLAAQHPHSLSRDTARSMTIDLASHSAQMKKVIQLQS